MLICLVLVNLLLECSSIFGRHTHHVQIKLLVLHPLPDVTQACAKIERHLVERNGRGINQRQITTMEDMREKTVY